MKCAHPENKGNDCDFLKCPRAGFETDWIELTQDEDNRCSYIRSSKWTQKAERKPREETNKQ
jgi:hypothetical protein